MSTTPQDRRKRASTGRDDPPDEVEAQDADGAIEGPEGAEREEPQVNLADNLRTRKIFELRSKS